MKQCYQIRKSNVHKQCYPNRGDILNICNNVFENKKEEDPVTQTWYPTNIMPFSLIFGLFFLLLSTIYMDMKSSNGDLTRSFNSHCLNYTWGLICKV